MRIEIRLLTNPTLHFLFGIAERHRNWDARRLQSDYRVRTDGQQTNDKPLQLTFFWQAQRLVSIWGI